jgi:hypothetical protein
LYYFTSAFQRGTATEVVEYLAAKATFLGILKRKQSTGRFREFPADPLPESGKRAGAPRAGSLSSAR